MHLKPNLGFIRIGGPFSHRRRGAALVLVVLMLPIIVGMVAFAVDVGLMSLLRSQVQNAVDSATLAASLKLREDPEAIAEAQEIARQFVQLNRVGTTITVPQDAIEVEIGRWDDETQTFVATTEDPNSVRVFARQDDEPFFFAQIFGHTTFGAPASAIATAAGSKLDIMMVLDLSYSMRSDGRIEALRNAAPVFVEVIDDINGEDQIGVMGLSANPGSSNSSGSGTNYNSGLHPSDDHHVGVLEQVLTDDFAGIRNSALSSGNLIAGKYQWYTGTGAALGDAAHYLENGSEARDDVEKVIVLMSDGYANRPRNDGPGYALAMAAYAASLDIKVYTISLGDGADVDLMQDIANATDGEHFDATGSGVDSLTSLLTAAFRKIASTIKRTQLVQ